MWLASKFINGLMLAWQQRDWHYQSTFVKVLIMLIIFVSLSMVPMALAMHATG